MYRMPSGKRRISGRRELSRRAVAFISLLAAFAVLAGGTLAFVLWRKTDSERSDGALTSLTSYTVTYVYNNGANNRTETLKSGAKISPTAPVKENCIFDDWYIDAACNDKYDFDRAVSGDLTLYAGYIPDYPKIANLIAMEYIKGNVTIIAKSSPTSSSYSQGSGVIFHEKNNRYYVLTNNHVVYAFASITVNDYTGVSYAASKLGGDKYNSAPKADYDLAVVSFTKSKTLKVIERAEKNAPVGEDVVSIGTPAGGINATTYGKIQTYGTVIVDADATLSNVKFPVIRHSAPMTSGASGGMLLNPELKIIGIHFAGNKSDWGGSCAIPVEKVNEFLELYVFVSI